MTLVDICLSAFGSDTIPPDDDSQIVVFLVTLVRENARGARHRCYGQERQRHPPGYVLPAGIPGAIPGTGEETHPHRTHRAVLRRRGSTICKVRLISKLYKIVLEYVSVGYLIKSIPLLT